jgi:hypothetical protein
MSGDILTPEEIKEQLTQLVTLLAALSGVDAAEAFLDDLSCDMLDDLRAKEGSRQ